MVPGLQNFVEEMSTISFDIEDHHGCPHRSYDSHFQPSDFIFVDDICNIAPQVVVAKSHVHNERTVAIKTTVAVMTERYTTVAT